MEKKYDLSVLMPAIRTHQWLKMYESLKLSCKKHTFQLVLVSPFDLPSSMKNLDNVKLVQDWGNPVRCSQLGVDHCDSDLIYMSTDDAMFIEDAIDHSLDYYNDKCQQKDILNMRYTEGVNRSGKTMPEGYWHAHSHDDMKLIGIPKNYKFSMQFICSKDYFKKLGGMDCQFEYVVYSLCDFCFRLQADGGIIHDSPCDVQNCDWYPTVTIDHKPIHEAQTNHDLPIFQKLYSSKENVALDRILLDFDDWKNTPAQWDRRFKGTKPNSYIDVMKLNNL